MTKRDDRKVIYIRVPQWIIDVLDKKAAEQRRSRTATLELDLEKLYQKEKSA